MPTRKAWRLGGKPDPPTRLRPRVRPQVEDSRVAKMKRMAVGREGRLDNQIEADRVTIKESRAAPVTETTD